MLNMVARISVLLIILGAVVVIQTLKISIWFNNQGVGAYEQHDYEKALGSFEMALRFSPGSVDTHYNLAALYEAMRKEGEAVAEYEKVIRLDKQYLQEYSALVEIKAARNNFEEAMDLANKAQDRIHTSATEELLKNISERYAAESARKGAEAISDGKVAQGTAFLNKAIELNPELLLPYQAFAIYYFKKGDQAKTLMYARKVVTLDPKNWMAYQLLGDIYFNQQAFAEAVGFYEQVLDFNQSEANVYNNLGISLMNLERLEPARRYLSKAVDLKPDDILFRYNLASVCRDGQHFDEAIRIYRQVLARQPDYPNVHNDLDDIYLHQGKIELAAEESAAEIKISLRHLEKNAGDVEVLNDLAYAYVRAGDVAKGRTLIERVITRAPTYRQAYLTLGAACKELKDIDCARQAFIHARNLSKETNFIDRELMSLRESAGKPN